MPSSDSSCDYKRNSSRRSKHKSSSYRSSSKSSRYRRKRSRSPRRSRSTSRDRGRYRKRSRSRDYTKSSKSSKSRSYRKSTSSSSYSSSSSSSSSSKSSSSTRRRSRRPATVPTIASQTNELREKLLQAIKAAESADTQLKQQGVLPKNVKSRNDISALVPNRPDIEIVDEIDNEGFVPKTFKSSKGKTVEQEKQGRKIVETITIVGEEKSLFHSSFFDDPQSKLDKWVKKLYHTRQKALQEGLRFK